MANIAGFLQGFLTDGADVHILDRGVSQLLGVVKRGQPVEAVVGNFGDSDVRFAGIGVRRRKMRLGKDAKQRCLAYLGQANDAGFHRRSF